jgi:hypothetical protein
MNEAVKIGSYEDDDYGNEKRSKYYSSARR